MSHLKAYSQGDQTQLQTQTTTNQQKIVEEGLILQGYFFFLRREDFRSVWKLVWMFIFLIVSVGKEGWVIQPAASASGLGPGSGSALLLAPQGTCAGLGRSHVITSTFALSFQQGSPRGVERSELS